MKKKSWCVVIIMIVIISGLAFYHFSGRKVCTLDTLNTNQAGMIQVLQVLKEHGFNNVRIVGQKPMWVYTKRARMSGTEFAVVAEKNNETNNIAAFYRTASGALMFFGEGNERFSLD